MSIEDVLMEKDGRMNALWAEVVLVWEFSLFSIHNSRKVRFFFLSFFNSGSYL